MSRIHEIAPTEAAALVGKGARMVDIREKAELSAGMIPGAAHAPLSRLAAADIGAGAGQSLIFYCQSGGRTKIYARMLEEKAGPREAFVLRGGVKAWRAAGLPLARPA